MKIAFLFVETEPNYDLVLQTLSRMNLEERIETTSYVRADLWSFEDYIQRLGLLSHEKRMSLVHALLVGEPGAIWQLKEAVAVSRSTLASEQNLIYVVQFDSLRQTLAQTLHRRLGDVDQYLGYTQVMLRPEGPHTQVFSALDPIMKLEHGKTFVLESDFDNSGVPDEIIEWAQRKYKGLEYYPLVESLSKRNIGTRFAISDISNGGNLDWKLHQALQIIGDEWTTQAERTISKMLDLAPSAVDELFSAVEVLGKPVLTSSECAHVAVSLRRCLERLTEVITPPLTREEKTSKECKSMGEYKFRLKRYVHEQLSQIPEYAEYLNNELDDLSNRIRSLVNLGNKGVHNDWGRRAFAIAVLRLILLLNELAVSRLVVKPAVLYDPAILGDDA